jgi:bifunctional non-homologous end joining protein LigD
LVNSAADLVYLANLAALEIHVPQWRVAADGPQPPDRVVVDLDPGPPAGLAACCEVALVARELMRADGLRPWPKVSGGKGLQLLAASGDPRPGATAAYARDLARRLTLALPALVVDRMDKAVRSGRVFIDWSQNNPAKNTVAAYSLRARPTPTVSAPLSWQEVAAAGDDLRFTPADLLARVAADGDLLAGLHQDEGPATLPVTAV